MLALRLQSPANTNITPHAGLVDVDPHDYISALTFLACYDPMTPRVRHAGTLVRQRYPTVDAFVADSAALKMQIAALRSRLHPQELALYEARDPTCVNRIKKQFSRIKDAAFPEIMKLKLTQQAAQEAAVAVARAAGCKRAVAEGATAQGAMALSATAQGAATYVVPQVKRNAAAARSRADHHVDVKARTTGAHIDAVVHSAASTRAVPLLHGAASLALTSTSPFVRCEGGVHSNPMSSHRSALLSVITPANTARLCDDLLKIKSACARGQGTATPTDDALREMEHALDDGFAIPWWTVAISERLATLVTWVSNDASCETRASALLSRVRRQLCADHIVLQHMRLAAAAAVDASLLDGAPSSDWILTIVTAARGSIEAAELDERCAAAADAAATLDSITTRAAAVVEQLAGVLLRSGDTVTAAPAFSPPNDVSEYLQRERALTAVQLYRWARSLAHSDVSAMLWRFEYARRAYASASAALRAVTRDEFVFLEDRSLAALPRTTSRPHPTTNNRCDGVSPVQRKRHRVDTVDVPWTPLHSSTHALDSRISVGAALADMETLAPGATPAQVDGVCARPAASNLPFPPECLMVTDAEYATCGHKEVLDTMSDAALLSMSRLAVQLQAERKAYSVCHMSGA